MKTERKSVGCIGMCLQQTEGICRCHIPSTPAINAVPADVMVVPSERQAGSDAGSVPDWERNTGRNGVQQGVRRI